MEVPSKVINSVKDVDSAMTNLYKVTDESQSRYSKYLDTASNNAPKLGRSMSSYISQTSEWSKLGYSLDDSEQLSKLSSMYANVGEVSDNTAVSDMVTAMKAFNIQASDAESIIDQLNILGNNFATSSADLGEDYQFGIFFSNRRKRPWSFSSYAYRNVRNHAECTRSWKCTKDPRHEGKRL